MNYYIDISEAAQRSQDVFRWLCGYLPVVAEPVVFKPESLFYKVPWSPQGRRI